MALQIHPYQMTNPDAYHRVVKAEHPTLLVDGESSAQTGLVSVTMHVYASAQARRAGEAPIQALYYDFAAPQGEDNLVRAAYLEARTRPLWAQALDV